MNRYCRYCEADVSAEARDGFTYCPDCGSNLGPADGAVAMQF